MVGFFSLLGGLTGILVETSIAAKLGLSSASDTFYVAFTVPYIITNLISATGQYSLVPFFASLDARHSQDDLWHGFSYATNLIFVGLTAIAAVGAATAPWLVRGIAPGFTVQESVVAARLARSLFFVIVPVGLSETLRSFLLSRRHFALPSGVWVLRNLIVIASIFATYKRFGEYSIVLGYYAGYTTQLVVLTARVLYSFPVRFRFTLKGGGEAFRNLHGAGATQIIVSTTWQGVVVVERIIASFLPPGTLTALHYGFKIVSTLVELLAGSVGTAALPQLSTAVARKDEVQERKTIRDTLEIALAVVTPAVVFCLLLDRNIIRLFFEHGNFTPQATSMLSSIFLFYSLALLPFAFMRVVTFTLFGRYQPGYYFRLAMLRHVSNVLFDLFFVVALGMGARGIPLGLLCSLLLAMILAFRWNLSDLREAVRRPFGTFALKVLLGAALSAAVIVGMRFSLAPPLTKRQNLIYLAELCSAGLLAHFLALAASQAVPVWPAGKSRTNT